MLALPEDIELLDKENQWIALAQRGDQQAFHQLYLIHHQKIMALAMRLAGDPRQAEEITQECFVRLWHKLPSFKGDSQFSTWLHRLCVNHALNMLKTQKSLWARFFNIDSAPEQSYFDEYQALDKVILTLPERARWVFVLHAVEGYQHNEIAEILKISEGTSKAQYHRARALLKEKLA
ncbi:sigma-70 family RNA polymerase sigma factor [Parashewanella curva]|uniref:Sigma-70 family RNA polymerase sigma factor n=1 Tax=Parashewanella curva TaxID=2338552 RepID=A0A3L8Q096_9GAMM|nr:sigma-70 family RNA polymerase sigma factor [Parashewanella curva]RLV60203.1 sigma-70 family RNA polymerase sigma factor [Parashewanella curva]